MVITLAITPMEPVTQVGSAMMRSQRAETYTPPDAEMPP